MVWGLRFVRDHFQFADERGDVAVHQFAGRRLGIKGAIRAFLRAERDVDIKTRDRRRF